MAQQVKKKTKRHVPRRKRNNNLLGLADLNAKENATTQGTSRGASKSNKERRPQRILRLITFNIQYGTPKGGWKDDEDWWGPKDIEARIQEANKSMKATIKELRALNPDILALQEVDKGQRRSGYMPQAQEIAAGLGLSYWRMFASFSGSSMGIHRRPYNSSIPNTAGHGLALATRWPVRSWRMKRLGKGLPMLDLRRVHWEGISKGFLRGLRSLPAALSGLRLKFGLQRIVASAQVITPFGVLSVATTHLETQKQVAFTQLRRAWRSAVGVYPNRCLLTGDFNLRMHEVRYALALLGEKEQPQLHAGEASYPADNPDFALDQLLANGMRLAGQPFSVRLPISDHRAMVYDLVM